MTLCYVSVFTGDKLVEFTLIRELMTIAPAFTIGLCGLSAQGTRACYKSYAPNHKSNKQLRLERIFHQGNLELH